MNLQEIQDILQPVDQLWDAAAAGAMHLLDFIGFESRSWQGYGWREEATGLVVSPFVDSPEILSSIVARISALLPESIKVEGLVLPPFLEIGSVPRKQSTQTNAETEDDAFQPGNAVQRDCPSACTGTIGAFLTAERDGSTWLLSNRHVMADCPSSQLLGAGRVLLGTDVRCVPVKTNGNAVDAAVAKVEDTSQVDPHFKKLGRLQEPEPRVLAQLRNGTEVRKLGNFTGVTSGKLVLHCPKVKVKDCAGMEREFVHQLAISEGDNGEFADNGDSGSLVVSGKQPIGLLFAMTGDDVEIPQNQSLKPPFYLANRWDLVIKELSAPGVVGSPLELMLDNAMATVG